MNRNGGNDREQKKKALRGSASQKTGAIQPLVTNYCTQSIIWYNALTMPHPIPIDISNIPELVRIAEEVDATKTSRELKWENKPIALITPITQTKSQRKRGKTEFDPQAFKATAGILKGLIDAEQLKKDISESRGLITRPPIKL
jgi:hypothetical protein